MIEKRRHRRGKVAATGLVWLGEIGPLHYLLENLSASGALLTGGPLLPVGQLVELTLYMANWAPVLVRARVVRHVDQRIGVSFLDVSAADEDAIQRTVLEALEAYRSGEAQSRHVLMVSQRRSVRDTLERELRALGHQVILATTILEAITLVQDRFAHFDVAVIDLDLGEDDGRELIGYLVEGHPEVRRVLMSGDVARYHLQLASLSTKVDAILPKPWDRRALAAAIAP